MCVCGKVPTVRNTTIPQGRVGFEIELDTLGGRPKFVKVDFALGSPGPLLGGFPRGGPGESSIGVRGGFRRVRGQPALYRLCTRSGSRRWVRGQRRCVAVRAALLYRTFDMLVDSVLPTEK